MRVVREDPSSSSSLHTGPRTLFSIMGMVMPKRLTPVSFDPWIINVTVLNAGQAGGSALCK
jgi:hypothetical protein